MSRVLDAILKKTKLVKRLMLENETLRHDLGAEKLTCLIAKNNLAEKKKEAEHAKAVIYAILSKNHICKLSKTGKIAITLEQDEINEGIGKVIHEDMNFPRTSITVYPE